MSGKGKRRRQKEEIAKAVKQELRALTPEPKAIEKPKGIRRFFSFTLGLAILGVLADATGVISFAGYSAKDLSTWRDAFYHKQVGDEDTILNSRTFRLLRKEEIPPLSLGECPGPDCLQFKLGKLSTSGNQLVQEFYLLGEGFKSAAGEAPNETRQFSPFRIKTGKGIANIGFPVGGGPKTLNIGLAKDTEVELFTRPARIKFYVLDTDAESLTVKLDIYAPQSLSERVGKDTPIKRGN